MYNKSNILILYTIYVLYVRTIQNQQYYVRITFLNRVYLCTTSPKNHTMYIEKYNICIEPPTHNAKNPNSNSYIVLTFVHTSTMYLFIQRIHMHVLRIFARWVEFQSVAFLISFSGRGAQSNGRVRRRINHRKKLPFCELFKCPRGK